MEKINLKNMLDEIEFNIKEGNFSELSIAATDVQFYGVGDIDKDYD